MDTTEAKTILSNLLEDYRAKSYGDLKTLLSAQDVFEVEADSGTKYQVEFQAVWDGEADGNLRVIGSIDDGGKQAFMPFTDDFIMSPNGEFVGE